MRHTANIFIGQDTKALTAKLGKYVVKYGEGDASSYFTSISWLQDENGNTVIKKSVTDESTNNGFVSTIQDLFNTRLEDVKILCSEDRALDMRHFFQDLHQSTVTINNPGDSNSLLMTLCMPLYDKQACEDAIKIIETTSEIQSRYSIMLVALCEDLGNIISPEKFRNITSDDEALKKAIQKEMLQKFTELKLKQSALEQIVLIQNTNSSGFALNLDQDSLLRIIGELSLVCIEKYNTVFPQSGSFDREHLVTSIGLSVMNLDKYYFEDYLLRRAYLRILENEDVMAEEVDLNKVAIVANDCLANHKNLFSDFYGNKIYPLFRKDVQQEAIIAEAAEKLRNQLKAVSNDLTSYIQSPSYTLPEKKGILAMILGYDDPLLKGNLFISQQLTFENLEEEAANYFIDANNECVKKEPSEDSDEEIIVYGPLGDLCADEEGKVCLPIEKLQKNRSDIRQSTNYIREKSKELETLGIMAQNAEQSEKRLTENGFIVDGTLYHLDVNHQEIEFDETYEPKTVKEKSIDLREYFTNIKDQGQIGACTVFSVSSIYEYILKKNSQKDVDLSESFVYYNVRSNKGKEAEDTGSSFQDVIKSIGEQGICSELLHPYTHSISDKPSDEAYADARTKRITKALNVKVREEDIKSAIQEGYPVAVSLKIFDSFNSTTGFVERPTEEELESADFGYHAMVIVGYTDETKFFVVRNSWGEHFGDKGYCYIPYSYICDPNLNRMACIISEIEYLGGSDIVVRGGGTGKKQIVQFNMSDAHIKAFVIKNLIEEELVNLRLMKAEDTKLRTEYETLMQTLGKQSKRTQILEAHRELMGERSANLKKIRDQINEIDRPEALRQFDANSWKTKFGMIGEIAFLLLAWGICASLFPSFVEWIQSSWCWMIVALIAFSGFILVMYWWYIKSQRRNLEIEFEEKTAQLSEKIQHFEAIASEQKIKMHIAGMIIDELLNLKASLDNKYQAMKSYIGNLSVWYDEEQKSFETMEPLVKNPFIPLLSNEKLNVYFEDNKDKITKGMHLYEYFEGYMLDDDAIIKFKRKLKDNVLKQIIALLNNFTIFRHIFAIRDYAFLDKEYASANNLFPTLDSKSDPFCQIKRTAVTTPQARFLFIHTDAEEEQAWKATYPQYFNTTPISEKIVSIYKIVGLRLQSLLPEEVILE